MDRVISLGPLALSLNILIWIGSLWFGIWVTSQVARRQGLHLYWQLYGVALLGLISARLGFVLQHLQTYLENPVSILNIRDGGWLPWAGFVVIALLVLGSALRGRPQARPFAAGWLTVALLGWATTAGINLVDRQAPQLASIQVSDMEGRELNLQSFKGQPLVVNLWATWCPPCVREMPVLQQAQQANPEIQFLFMNQGESRHQVQTFLSRHSMSLENLLLDVTGQVGQTYGSRLLPTTLFFNSDGSLADVRLGELSKATLDERLDRITPH